VVVVYLPLHHNSPPLTPRSEPEENFEEEENSESDSEGEEQLQLVLYNPQTMDGNNQNPPPYQPWLVPDVIFHTQTTP
jgi:hypothetical protein